MKRLPKIDLTSIEDLSIAEIERIFTLADGFADRLARGEKLTSANGLIMATLFYEPSTRTRLSFEAAMHRLGGAVISSPDMHASSAAKGESLADTIRVVGGYADLIVLRHPHDGAARVAADYAPCAVVNAGDGSREHPTQTLCDLYVLRRKKGHLRGLTVALCGDLRLGRTVHSLIYALARFGANIIAVPGKGMEVPGYVLARLAAERNYSLATVTMDEFKSLAGSLDALYLTPNAPHQMALFTGEVPIGELPSVEPPAVLDAFYVTRLQRERREDDAGSNASYVRLDVSALRSSRTHEAVVMHPLPRTDELAFELDSDPRAVYFEQARAGVPVRMALIEWMIENAAQRQKCAGPEGAVVSFRSGTATPCGNPNCVTHFEGPYLRPRFRLTDGRASGGFSLRCDFCERRLEIEFVGHSRSRRYYRYDETLAGYVRRWIDQGTLAVFESVKQAEENGYEPYRRGPQREIMNGADIANRLAQVAHEITRDLPDLTSAAIVGVVSHGAILAVRLRMLIEAQVGLGLPCALLDLFERSGALRPLDGSGEFSAEGRTIILVDDVFNSGWTIERALTRLWQHGRPAAVKLAVLIDRGHRAVPIRPNYVGKHIPTSRAERVEVRLRSPGGPKGKAAADSVTIYSIVDSPRVRERVR